MSGKKNDRMTGGGDFCRLRCPVNVKPKGEKDRRNLFVFRAGCLLHGFLPKHIPSVFLMAVLLFSGCEQTPGTGGFQRDSNASLKSLSLSAGNLTPSFDAGITEYRAEVNNRVTSVSITADPAGRNASVSVTGNKSLTDGENTVTVTVEAEDSTKKTYTITVQRLTGTVASITSASDLKKIGMEEGYSLAGDYRLDSDLTLENWRPIGSNTLPFSGSLDGKGHTITLKGFHADVLSTTTNK
jgi:hypothetical protein